MAKAPAKLKHPAVPLVKMMSPSTSVHLKSIRQNAAQIMPACDAGPPSVERPLRARVAIQDGACAWHKCPIRRRSPLCHSRPSPVIQRKDDDRQLLSEADIAALDSAFRRTLGGIHSKEKFSIEVGLIDLPSSFELPTI